MNDNTSNISNNSNQCDSSNCSCNSNTNLSRRKFLSLTMYGAAGAMVSRSGLPVMAGPFEENEYLSTIPFDKKLAPNWVASLTARGKQTEYTDPKALGHIGMPIGGICSGNMYLGGDGKLWLWDVFNRVVEGILPRPVEYNGENVNMRGGANYVSPAPQDSPIEQGFVVRVNDKIRNLDRSGFNDITFKGQYPIGEVSYRDMNCPVSVKLEAYSPFIPLNTDDSSLPATVMSYTLKNESGKAITTEISGHLENSICLYHRDKATGTRRNRIVRGEGSTYLSCTAEPLEDEVKSTRPDIVFEDFEKENYEDWTVTGTAFGDSPIKISDIPGYQGNVGGKGKRVVNSHNVRKGEDVGGGDRHVGTLTSKSFILERKYINFLIGGGSQKDKTCVNLLVDGQVVQTAVGQNNNRMNPASFNVDKLQDKKAQLQIVDQVPGGWGNVGVDHIVFSDQPARSQNMTELHDFGTMGLMVLSESEKDVLSTASVKQTGSFQESTEQAQAPLQEKLIGALGRKLTLEPGEKQTVTFVVVWHFPNLSVGGMNHVGRSYAARFVNAKFVAGYVKDNFERLSTTTRKWRDTWYDSTLPYWFLDRTMVNTTTLATSTCYRFKDGRFWAWEGIGCCHGTCTHVWHYAQAVGRLFPEIERDHRERVDFGIALHGDGGIGHRAGLNSASHSAHDGQCGRILGAYREHQMSADDAFLKRNWSNIKKAIEFMIKLDSNDDGVVEGSQPNTLDAAWFGKISFLASLYLATLKAGEAMASEMGDETFARHCRKIAERGGKSILEMFNGEYFYQIEDEKHRDKIGVGPGCYIDQVFGQSWANQVGLGRLFDEEKCKSALRALWKYNFVPDVGPFRETFKQGRWYALAGDAGLLMCTWPRGGQNPNFKNHWQYMYFNECMSGFEWQAAAHMIDEGMLTEGLAIARAIHDRYNAALRNPYNEIECSDHYARAMASYGAFISTCGYEYHGPKGYLAFAPKLNPDNFKAPFTTAQGWGTFSQNRSSVKQNEKIEIKWGKLRLKDLEFELPTGRKASRVKVAATGKKVKSSYALENERLKISLASEVIIGAGEAMEIEII
jgi:non-lysosomal glucosylceramidase